MVATEAQFIEAQSSSGETETGCRITGLPISDQVAGGRGPCILVPLGGSAGIIADGRRQAASLFGTQPVEVVVDFDRNAERFAQDARVVVLSQNNIVDLLDDLRRTNPEAARLADELLRGHSLFNLDGRGAGDRAVSTFALDRNREVLRRVVDETVSAFAPAGQPRWEGTTLARARTLDRPVNNVQIIFLNSMVGNSGNVLAAYLAVQFRQAFAARKIEALFVQVMTAPVAYTKVTTSSTPADERQRVDEMNIIAYDHAAAVLIEQQAIAAGGAALDDYTRQPLFDLTFVVDEPAPTDEAGRETWLRQIGAGLPLLLEALGRGPTAGHIFQYLKDRPDQIPLLIGTFAIRIAGIDLAYLAEACTRHGVLDALDQLANGVEAKDPDPATSRLEGQEFAKTLLPPTIQDVETIVTTRPDGTRVVTPHYNYERALASGQDKKVVAKEQEGVLAKRDGLTAPLLVTVSQILTALLDHDRRTIREQVAVRRADDQPVAAFLEGAADGYTDQAKAMASEAATAKLQRDAADQQARVAQYNLRPSWFKDWDFAIKSADLALNAFVKADFDHAVRQAIHLALQRFARELREEAQFSALAAEKARTAKPAAEANVKDLPAAPSDTLDLGPKEHDEVLIHTIIDGFRVSPAVLANLSDDAVIPTLTTIVAAEVARRLRGFTDPVSALGAKVQYARPDFTTDAARVHVVGTFQHELIDVTRTVDAGALFDATANTFQYVVTNVEDLPELGGDVTKVVTAPDFAPDFRFLAYIRIRYGALPTSFAWFPAARNRLLQQQPTRNAFVVPMRPEFLADLASAPRSQEPSGDKQQHEATGETGGERGETAERPFATAGFSTNNRH